MKRLFPEHVAAKNPLAGRLRPFRRLLDMGTHRGPSGQRRDERTLPDPDHAGFGMGRVACRVWGFTPLQCRCGHRRMARRGTVRWTDHPCRSRPWRDGGAHDGIEPNLKVQADGMFMSILDQAQIDFAHIVEECSCLRQASLRRVFGRRCGSGDRLGQRGSGKGGSPGVSCPDTDTAGRWIGILRRVQATGF